jgi:hypothetical protein
MNASAARADAAGRSSRGRSTKSAVTNGKRLHVIAPGDNAWNRRFRDLVGSIISDLGGDPDQLSEGQKQLCRRAAGLSLECEKLESLACGAPSAVEEAFRQNSGGLSPREILGEAGRILHGIARVRIGDGGIRHLAELPRPELDHVVDLLTKAADIASKAAAAGADTAINVERYGTLCGNGMSLGELMRLDIEERRQEEAAAVVVTSGSLSTNGRAGELPEAAEGPSGDEEADA